jgi:hypothetical protein
VLQWMKPSAASESASYRPDRCAAAHSSADVM